MMQVRGNQGNYLEKNSSNASTIFFWRCGRLQRVLANRNRRQSKALRDIYTVPTVSNGMECAEWTIVSIDHNTHVPCHTATHCFERNLNPRWVVHSFPFFLFSWALFIMHEVCERISQSWIVSRFFSGLLRDAITSRNHARRKEMKTS